MKKYKLNLRENEELIVDVDDTIEALMPNFIQVTNKLKHKHALYFNNWVSLYKTLNYDTIEGLVVDDIYRVNDYAAVIELTFNGKKEYDFLVLNHEDMTVSCMNRKENSVRNYLVRRLLAPQSVEEALSFAKSKMSDEAIKQLMQTAKDIETKGERYKVILQDKFVTENVIVRKPVEEPKAVETTEEQQPVEEPKTTEEQQPVEEPKTTEEQQPVEEPKTTGFFSKPSFKKTTQRKFKHEMFAYSELEKGFARKMDKLDEILTYTGEYKDM